jgi:RiboL-PSP-HEPN
MFSDLQVEVASRILATSRHYRACLSPGFRGNTAVSRGLVFVELYATYEYTVKEMVRESLQAIKASGMTICTARMELLGLLLHAESSAARDAGKERIWETRTTLFRRINAVEAITTADDVFPNDGSHFRLQQLRTIWEIFGITKPVLPDVSLNQLIGELVLHRNAIAHGDATPNEIGRRYSETHVLRKIDDVQRVCAYLVTTMESHCAVSANLTR